MSVDDREVQSQVMAFHAIRPRACFRRLAENAEVVFFRIALVAGLTSISFNT